MINIIGFVLDFISFYALYLAISLSLNLEFGYAGIPNFGKVLFIAGGAAFSASITGRIALWALNVGKGQDFGGVNNFAIMGQVNNLLLSNPLLTIALVILGLIIGAIVGGLLGYIFSYPAIHLREDYLGLLLLGMAQFFDLILRSSTWLDGGTQPLSTVNPFYYFSSLGVNDLTGLATAVAMGAFAILVYLYVERTVRSPLGRTLRAMRDNDAASAALGKDTAQLRMKALVIASAIAGVAGTMYMFQYAYIDSSTWTRFAWTFWPFLIVILGGAANNTGVVVGSFLFVMILKGLEQIQPLIAPYVFFTPSYIQDLLFAVLLLAILYLRPEGVIRERSSFTLPAGVLQKIVHGKEREPPVAGVGAQTEGVTGANSRQSGERAAEKEDRPPP